MLKRLLSYFLLVTGIVLFGAGCLGTDDGSNNIDPGNGNNNPPTGTTGSPATNTTGTVGTPAPTGTQGNTGTSGGTTTGITRRISVSAKQFQFSPSTITVKKGDTVVLTVKSEDVAHGLAIQDFNVNLNIPPGQTRSVTFVADKTGSFQFRCSVPCGEGHQTMTGTLIVQE